MAQQYDDSTFYTPPVRRNRPSLGATSPYYSQPSQASAVSRPRQQAAPAPRQQQQPQMPSMAAFATLGRQAPGANTYEKTQLPSVDFNYAYDPTMAKIGMLGDLDVSTAENSALAAKKEALLGFGSLELARQVLSQPQAWGSRLPAGVDPSTRTNFAWDPPDGLKAPEKLNPQSGQLERGEIVATSDQGTYTVRYPWGETDTVSQFAPVQNPSVDPNDAFFNGITDDPDKGTSVLSRINRGYRDTVQTNEDNLNESNLGFSGHRGQVLRDLAQDKGTMVSDATSAVQNVLGQADQGVLAAKRLDMQRRIQAANDAAMRKLLADLMRPPVKEPTETTPEEPFGQPRYPGDEYYPGYETDPNWRDPHPGPYSQPSRVADYYSRF